MSREMITFRLESELKARLDRVTDRDRDDYAPTKTQVLQHGLELALRELEAKRGRK